MSLLENDQFRAYLNRRILCEVETPEKVIALTFDDGPNPQHTPALLNLLSARSVPATFFVVGRRVRRFGEIVRRLVTEGHEIGNHTNRHVPLSALPRPLIRRELRVTEELIVKETGAKPKFMRPPFGWYNDRVLSVARAMGYRPVIGSIHPRDSRKPGTEFIVEHVTRRASAGGIIILHDGGWRVTSDRRQSVDAVDRIIDTLAARGFRFVTLSQLVAAASHRDGAR